MKSRLSRNILLLFPLLLSILLMAIGYASINSITGEIQGTVIAEVQSGVFITDIQYVSDVDANINTSKIDYYVGTMMQSTVELSNINPASEIKYKVTVYNNSEDSVPFVGVVYDDEYYDNLEITFKVTGFVPGQVIEPKETKEIIINFKYKDVTTVPENTALKSYLNFKMNEPNRMVAGTNSSSTGKYLTGTITKNQIESIKFEQGKELDSTNIISRFDASAKQNESIIGYYTDKDNNDLYELTFVSEEMIFANKSSSYLFYNLTSLENIEFDNFSTWGVTSMYGIFAGCSGLTSLDVSKFDTSQVTTVRAMFYNCSGLTQLDLSNFNTSQVWTMEAMFNGCSGLTTLNVSSFNTSRVTNMYNMFYRCSGLTQLDLSNFNTSQVSTIGEMFNGCSGLTTLDVSGFNTSKLTNMSRMFNGCRGLTTLDLSSFDTSQVTNMYAMFYNCSGLTQLDLSNFNTSQVLTMEEMFNGCSGLTTLNVSSFNTSKLASFVRIFNGCSGLTQLDLSSFNTSKVTNMYAMFNSCSKLKNIYVRQYDESTNTGWTTSAVTSSGNMFSGCTNIIGGNGTKYNSSYTGKTYARIDTAEEPGYFTDILDKHK